ncbi:serine hydrolase domain-containing protein [Olleya sp. HaHaR_3_96]|uniref:serine hydrolase domain-containing protein n=1 Tax=Olleya sp. HaHaR_3_96 TaxID=2745560 RepID=UPI001C4FB8DD|nr:serine hydrolase [Olleya sp. HaHaR_3_96]QXP61605.1 serine hydrolase [Olleya sp. HaHaR_3_96]
MKPLLILLSLLLCFCFSCTSENAPAPTENQTTTTVYFPPINSNSWDTVSTSDLNWNSSALNELSLFLEASNTKSFIILHKGKIAYEQYFNGHTDTSPWYWASAGKTLTATVTGIAQDQGLLNLNNKVSDYIGTGWTNATLEQEALITCKQLLSMSSGLDDTLGEVLTPNNLQYVADAGTRWAYHNVYLKLQTVIAQASNQTWTTYFNDNLKDVIGMTGAWIAVDDLNIYWSTSRSMARFGLLIYANGRWEDAQIISEQFLNEATNTSQNNNQAYGYLWWLNGKNSFQLPQSQVEFSGTLIPNAPSDMYCALGKNDQKIYIVPSKDLVIIRMGDAADASNFALSNYDTALWEKINAVLD